eukprot:GEMP01033840.1.p1 GENE.GEMP01033840.1~~GEMP01033840.1.p1  ORF type:complete len:258 (+),score=35.39 GEMP01033840.1:396-1169(+)
MEDPLPCNGMEERDNLDWFGRASSSESALSNETLPNSVVISEAEVSLVCAIDAVKQLVAEVHHLNSHGLLSSWQEIIELGHVVQDAKQIVLAKLCPCNDSPSSSQAQHDVDEFLNSSAAIQAQYYAFMKDYASAECDASSDKYFSGVYPNGMDVYSESAWCHVMNAGGRVLAGDNEDWDRRFATREKQVALGKATTAYTIYCIEVPRELRNEDHPVTPRIYDRTKSKRGWKYEVEAWRRELRRLECSYLANECLNEV